MNNSALVARLETNPGAIISLVAHLSVDQARWRPAPDKWSILEVVCHLVDEEREDFRTRLDLTLHQPGAPWPGIDPPGWVSERHYQERDFAESLQAFTEEREASLRWLQTLKSPAWDNRYEHPLLDTITAGDLLVSWVAHDFLHLRQLIGLHWQQTMDEAVGYSADYAGNW